MSETIDQIRAEVKSFLDSERSDVVRSLSRTAVFNSYGSEITIDQTKYLNSEDIQRIRVDGPDAYMTADWFNDVEWIQQLDEQRPYGRQLSLDATYPMDYFVEKPTSGTFQGDKWLDQYGAISGFGSEGRINLWVLDFVTPDSRAVTSLHYPEDPTALDQYNARYQQYLRNLSEAIPTIGYYRGWDRAFSDIASKTSLVRGSMTLAGLGINEILAQGSPETEDQAEFVRLLFHYDPEQNGYVGRDLTIDSEGVARTEPYWDGEDEEESASDELLKIALELLRDTANS